LLQPVLSIHFALFNIEASELPSDHEFYGATGRKLYMNATMKQDLRTVLLFSRKSINRQNCAGQVMLDAAFDISSHARLSELGIFPLG
jgi:hypothetical protein